ncbi:MAG: hypothetical protein ABIL76_03500 [candidate division WOR-3 bacterium]
MIFILFDLTVWQNIYIFDQRTRGTNVLLLNNDTIIISGGYGDNFPNTIVVKLDQLGNYIDSRKTSDSRGGIVPGGYVINPSNEVVITGEGIIDQNLNNKDITILKINTTSLTVNANKVIGLTGAKRDELGQKILPYKSDTFIVGYKGFNNNLQNVGIAKIIIQPSQIIYLNSRSFDLTVYQFFGSMAVVNDTIILISNGSDNYAYLYLIKANDYSVLNSTRLPNTRINDVKFYNNRFYITGSYNNDVFLAKLDRNLSILRACYFTPNSLVNNNDYGVRLFNINNYVLILGNSNSFGDGYDVFALVSDTNCSSIIAQSRYGTVNNDYIYDAYRSPISIVAVGESDYSSPISIYAIRIEGNAFLSCSEKPISFVINNIMPLNLNFTYNFSSINDKGNANFDFTSSNPILINKSIICTPLISNENKNCLKFEIVKNGIRIYGEGNLEIYSLNGKLVFKGIVHDNDFIMLDKGFYIINRRKVFIY